MRLSELSSKDVIRDEDGVKLGRINDLIIDTATGKIISICLSSGFKISSIFKGSDQSTISYSKIQKIGSDVIIIDTKTTS